MNIELKPIAESKVRQLGGDVCGVLVRNEAGAYAAVDEHGRVMWLDSWGEAARAQGGQGAEVEPAAYLLLWPDGSPWGAVNSQSTVEMWMKRADEGRTVKPLYTQPQPAVPEGWRECLTEMVQAMYDYEMSVEEDAPYKHRAMMDRAHALLSTPTTPQADGDWYCSACGMKRDPEGCNGQQDDECSYVFRPHKPAGQEGA